MSEPNETPQTQAPQPVDPLEFLQQFPGAPSRQHLENLKKEVPGGKLRIFSPDGKRVFILRGISGLEMAKLQAEVPKNSSNPEWDLQLKACAACIVWSSLGHLDEMALRAGPAGLPDSLWALIQSLSDFYDPVQLATFSAEL